MIKNKVILSFSGLKYLVLILFVMESSAMMGQSYERLVNEADSCYYEGDYIGSGRKYELAFKVKDGTKDDYYNAACSWALSGNRKLGMKYIQIAAKYGWKDYKHISNDTDLASLHSMKGWSKVLETVKSNLDDSEKGMDKGLIAELEEISIRDQTLRLLLDDAEKEFGKNSDEISFLWRMIMAQDSINQIQVKKIIDTHGWLGKSEVGAKGNRTIWGVIQHAPLETQEKYLPLLEKSVNKGESDPSDLALLKDRVALRQGKRQIYGSQIYMDSETKEMYVAPLIDPENVDKRRAEVGLGKLADYVRSWNIVWDVKKHKERIARIEAKIKKEKN